VLESRSGWLLHSSLSFFNLLFGLSEEAPVFPLSLTGTSLLADVLEVLLTGSQLPPLDLPVPNRVLGFLDLFSSGLCSATDLFRQ